MNKVLDWAETNFGKTQLWNLRRTKRVVNVAARLAENKGQSLAKLFDSWYDVKATYNLLRHNTMTPDVIQAQHRELAFERMIEFDGDVLAIEDASELEWNGHEPVEGLGPIGSGRETDQGFVLHTTLALGITKDAVEVLGLPFQQYYVRPPKREKKVNRATKCGPMETDLWREVIKKKAIPSLGKVIRVCDRNADIYEVMIETIANNNGFIIRLSHDRVAIEEGLNVKELMREIPSMGQTQIELRGRNGTKKRTIPLEVNWTRTQLRAPSRPGKGIGKLTPLEISVVHAWGKDPETEEFIEWFLYTNLELNDLYDAKKVLRYYTLRWTVEDFHKALKTGLRVERLQLETAHALFAAVSIMSVVALRLLKIREALRVDLEAPADRSGIGEFELKILAAYLKRELKTVRCVALAIGRLGGHQNRKSDGMPGIMTLWIGMTRLVQMAEGARLATNLNF